MTMTETRGQLRPEQVAQLLEAVKPHRVKQLDGKSHMEGYDIRAHLTRIFGFEGWDIEAAPAECIHDVQLDTGRTKDNGWSILRYSCAYRQHLTLVVYDPDGHVVKRVIGQAVGKAENQPSFGDAHDLALKDAETQALKRAAMNLGDQYGLGLYNKQARDGHGGYKAAVKVTLVRMPEAPGAELVTPEVGEEDDDARRAVDSATPGEARIVAVEQDGQRYEPAPGGGVVHVGPAQTESGRPARADTDMVTQDDLDHLGTIMGALTKGERERIRAERTEKGLSIAPGQFTVGTLHWLLQRAQEMTDLREKAEQLQQQAPPEHAGEARRRAGGAKLASKQQRDTIATKLAELAPDVREGVEGWAKGAGHDLVNLAESSFQPVMLAITNAARAARLRGRTLSKAPAGADAPPEGPAAAPAPAEPPPPPDPEAERRALRRQQWTALSGSVEALGAEETWPMVREELEGVGITLATDDGAAVALKFCGAGAEHDAFLAEMVDQYAEVASGFLERPFEEGEEKAAALTPEQADALARQVAEKPAPDPLDDVDF
jgi:hypothetical protein